MDRGLSDDSYTKFAGTACSALERELNPKRARSQYAQDCYDDEEPTGRFSNGGVKA